MTSNSAKFGPISPPHRCSNPDGKSLKCIFRSSPQIQCTKVINQCEFKMNRTWKMTAKAAKTCFFFFLNNQQIALMRRRRNARDNDDDNDGANQYTNDEKENGVHIIQQLNKWCEWNNNSAHGAPIGNEKHTQIFHFVQEWKSNNKCMRCGQTGQAWQK